MSAQHAIEIHDMIQKASIQPSEDSNKHMLEIMAWLNQQIRTLENRVNELAKERERPTTLAATKLKPRPKSLLDERQ